MKTVAEKSAVARIETDVKRMGTAAATGADASGRAAWEEDDSSMAQAQKEQPACQPAETSKAEFGAGGAGVHRLSRISCAVSQTKSRLLHPASETDFAHT